MNAAYRTSPLYSVIAPLKPAWVEVNRMRIPLRFSDNERTVMEKLALCDLSFLSRFGVKGPGAADWLKSQGVTPPADINHWDELENGVIVRLGSTEFFIEDGLGGSTAVRLKAALDRGLPGVTPVLRQDAALAVTGCEINSLLVQTCNVNFNGFGSDDRLAIMTSMVGVSVLVVRKSNSGIPFYRIWCDGTFGPYLWETLLEIAQELGGAAIGLGTLFPQAASQMTFSK